MSAIGTFKTILDLYVGENLRVFLSPPGVNVGLEGNEVFSHFFENAEYIHH